MHNITGDRWLEIDVDAIRHNLQQVKSRLDESVRLIAVIKADAYGHGAAETARILYQNGVDFFAVTFLEEALILRKAGIRASIMLLSPLVGEEQFAAALDNHITITITSLYEAQLLDEVTQRLNTKPKVHLKIDTGLGRFGIKPEDLVEVCQTLKKNSGIYIEGIYTHMAEAAARNSAYTLRQFNQFINIIDELKEAGFSIPVCHCANSAVFLKYPQMHLNAVRIGTLLSGEVPAGQGGPEINLVDPFKFKTRIISLRTLPRGSYLGYFRTARLRQDAMVAVIPVGFNHGLALQVANRPTSFMDLVKILIKRCLAYFNVPRFNLQVKINGHLYPIRGKVFMQMALVEIPLQAAVKVGDEVEVPMRKTLMVKGHNRVYVKDGEPCKIEDNERTTYIVEEN